MVIEVFEEDVEPLPAATSVIVNGLIDPRMLVEIEVDAIVGE